MARRPSALPSRRRPWPWAVAGALVGAALTLLVQAPAAWLASLVASATGERVQLADARGSFWSGSAVLVLGGGAGSRDASALPGRLRWTFGLARENRSKLEVRLRHLCCIDDQIRLRVEPGWGRFKLSLPEGRAPLGRWPAAWLAGLGTPFNTLQLGGALRLTGDGLAIDTVQGRMQVTGSAEFELLAVSSRLSPLPVLGSYRLIVDGGPAGEGAALRLVTLHGPLQLRGSGQWVGPRLRFRGEAQADAGSEAALNNLLNLLGRRQGALAILSIG